MRLAFGDTHTYTLTRFQSSSSSSFSSSYSSSSALLWPLVLCAIEFSFPSRTTLSRTFLHATPHKNALPDDPHATLPSLPSNALTVTHKRTHTLASFPLPVFPASFPSFPPICPALFYGVMLFSKSANTRTRFCSAAHAGSSGVTFALLIDSLLLLLLLPRCFCAIVLSHDQATVPWWW